MGNGQSIELFLIASLVLGVGFGVLEVLGTSASKSLQSETASRLTRLQAIFAVSAFITPVLFALAATAFSSTTGFYLIFAFAITFALLYRGSDRVQAQKRVFKKTNRTVFAFMLAAVFYVGAETVIAGWSSVLVSELGGLDAKDSGNSVALTSTLVLAGSVGGFVLPGILQTLPEIESAALIAGCGFVAALIFSLAGNVKTNSVAHSKETV